MRQSQKVLYNKKFMASTIACSARWSGPVVFKTRTLQRDGFRPSPAVGIEKRFKIDVAAVHHVEGTGFGKDLVEDVDSCAVPGDHWDKWDYQNLEKVDRTVALALLARGQRSGAAEVHRFQSQD